MRKNNIHKKIVLHRLKVILDLARKEKDASKVEKEIALLALDIFTVLQMRSFSLKQGCQCFRRIDYAISLAFRKKLSEECRDLLNEGILLDEIGTAYGPDIATLLALIRTILNRVEKFTFVMPRAKAAIKITVKIHDRES